MSIESKDILEAFRELLNYTDLDLNIQGKTVEEWKQLLDDRMEKKEGKQQ